MRFLSILVFALAATPIAFAQSPKAKLPEGVTAHSDLEYVKDGHMRQKLDLYLPKKSEGTLPVIVWIHGGAWSAGSKDNCPALPYTEKGYQCVEV